jgi:hypothetical protein
MLLLLLLLLLFRNHCTAAPPPPQVYGTQSVHTFLHTNQPWKSYLEDGGNFTLMQPLVPGHQIKLSTGVSVEPTAVPHRGELSDTMGFYIQVKQGRLIKVACECSHKAAL